MLVQQSELRRSVPPGLGGLELGLERFKLALRSRLGPGQGLQGPLEEPVAPRAARRAFDACREMPANSRVSRATIRDSGRSSRSFRRT